MDPVRIAVRGAFYRVEEESYPEPVYRVYRESDNQHVGDAVTFDEVVSVIRRDG